MKTGHHTVALDHIPALAPNRTPPPIGYAQNSTDRHSSNLHSLVTQLLTLVLILATTSYAAWANASKSAADAMRAGFWKLSVTNIGLNHQIGSVINPSSGSLLLSDDKRAAVFESAQEFNFVAPSDGVYSLQYQCDTRVLFAVVMGDDGQILSLPTTYLQAPRINKISLALKENQDVWIGIGEVKPSRPVAFRIGMFSGENGMAADRNREYSSASLGGSVYKSVVDRDAIDIPVTFFQLVRSNSDMWVSITAKSPKVAPYIIVLDKSDSEVTHEIYREETETSSRVVIGPHTAWTSFGVQQLQRDNSMESPIKLNIFELPYNPNHKILNALTYYMGSPLLSFCAGGVLALFISFWFYRRSLTSKVLYVEMEKDTSVIDTDNEREPLLFGPNKEPIRCASACTVRVWRVGYGHVTSADIINPLVLRLINISRMVTFQYQISRQSWFPPKAIEGEPNALTLDFSSLAHGDSVVITALCEQPSMQFITAVLDGRIRDTVIRTRALTPASVLRDFGTMLPWAILGIVLAALVIPVVDWLDIEDFKLQMFVLSTFMMLVLLMIPRITRRTSLIFMKLTSRRSEHRRP